MEDSKFWLVWSPQGGAPSHRHPQEGIARAEAIRLASLRPQQEFIVLEALTSYKTAKPPVSETVLK